ncbi:MAG: hypothetical protein ABSE63_02910 [Thermoguttaceae bacterium]|jgi:hypothetical protein
MSPDIRQPRVTEQTDEQVAEYRSISGWAVAGLVMGLLSPLALADPLLWAVPIIAGMVCIRAFGQIKQKAPAMIGRKAALAGLWLAVFSLTAAYSDWFYFRWRIREEARQAALFWFELLAKDRPELAFQLTLLPRQRHALDDRIWEFYVDSENSKIKWFTEFKKYIAPGKTEESPNLVRTLLALGDSAEVRYLGTLDQFYVDLQYVVDQLYAVTFVESGAKKTFFVLVRQARLVVGDKAVWRIIYAQGGVDQYGMTASKIGE